MEFRCHVLNYASYGLEMFVGDGAKIFPIHELNELGKNFTESLHPGEFFVDKLQGDNCTAMSCEGMGIFWMVVNSRTLPLVDYFWCRATDTNQQRPEDSNQAFIVNVLYPECDNRTSVTTKLLNMSVTTTTIPLPSTTCKTMSNVHSGTTVTINNGSQNLIFTWLLFIFPLCVYMFMWL